MDRGTSDERKHREGDDPAKEAEADYMMRDCAHPRQLAVVRLKLNEPDVIDLISYFVHIFWQDFHLLPEPAPPSRQLNGGGASSSFDAYKCLSEEFLNHMNHM
jgi:hypothetical protein